MIGQTLLHYRITDRLGAGGMGEVYLARDEKLNRDVALKVLPAGALADGEARKRFRKEADALSQLSHPHVATLFDFDSVNGTDFLVMELVRGPSLRDQIEKEGALPEKVVVRLGSQLARGLQAAHEKGIVHRDLKPSNLQLTEDGLLKILDFGLARLLPREPGPDEETAATQTALGKVAGTLLYMSPEQLRGRGVDERTDVYSAGAVLYEMGTGKRLFSKPSAAELTEAILSEEPKAPRELSEQISPGLEAVILKALDKDPELRHQTAKDLRADLERLLQRSDSYTRATPLMAGTPAEPTGAPRWRRGENRERLFWGGLALLLAGLVAFLARRAPHDAPEPLPVVRFDIAIPDTLAHRGIDFAVSPDGQHVAMASHGGERIWLRSLGTPGTRALPGTDGGHMPFWSPDASALAFFVRSGQGELTLRRVSLEPGEARAICTVSAGIWSGGTWNEAGRILFSVGEWQKTGTLYSVSADGGEAHVLLEPDVARQERALWSPQFLPDGRRFLFHVWSEEPESHGFWVSSLDHPDEKALVLAGVTGGFVASGHLVYSRERSPSRILAQAFDADRARPTGEPVTISSGADNCEVGGSVLACEEASGPPLELVWFARDGARLGTLGPPGDYSQVQLSPNGRQAAVSTSEGISLVDVARGVPTRVVSGWVDDPLWSADGRALFFWSTNRSQDVKRIHRKDVDAVGEPRVILESPEWAFPEGVTPDGKELVYLTGFSPNNAAWSLSLEGRGEPTKLVQVDYALDSTVISPDGRWMAYAAKETGEWAVYVRPFRREGERKRVSPEGGLQPTWRGDGRELFYLTREGQLMAVEVEEKDGHLDVGLPTALFDAGVSDPAFDQYTVTRDGQRFLVIRSVQGARSLRVTLNWPSLLEQ